MVDLLAVVLLVAFQILQLVEGLLALRLQVEALVVLHPPVVVDFLELLLGVDLVVVQPLAVVLVGRLPLAVVLVLLPPLVVVLVLLPPLVVVLLVLLPLVLVLVLLLLLVDLQELVQVVVLEHLAAKEVVVLICLWKTSLLQNTMFAYKEWEKVKSF